MSTIPEDAAPPDGWVLVPVEPTREMLEAAGKYADGCAIHNYGGSPDAEGTWEAMLSSAPPPPIRDVFRDLGVPSPAPDGWLLVQRDAAQKACADMLDRIIASMETMTRPMMLDWLNRERAALGGDHE